MRYHDLMMNFSSRDVDSFYPQPCYCGLYEWYCCFDLARSIKKTFLISGTNRIDWISDDKCGSDHHHVVVAFCSSYVDQKTSFTPIDTRTHPYDASGDHYTFFASCISIMGWGDGKYGDTDPDMA